MCGSSVTGTLDQEPFRPLIFPITMIRVSQQMSGGKLPRAKLFFRMPIKGGETMKVSYFTTKRDHSTSTIREKHAKA